MSEYTCITVSDALSDSENNESSDGAASFEGCSENESICPQLRTRVWQAKVDLM